jgi:hypothetical protein
MDHKGVIFMQWNRKSNWGIVAGSLLAFTTLVNADVTDAQMRNLDNRVSALEQRRGASGMVNPPARPQVINGADIFAYGDLLYWKANENGIPLAVVNNGSELNLNNAKVNNLRGRYDFAFRVGIGYDIPHDGWDLSLSWLRYNSNGHRKHIHSHTGRYVFPTLAPSTDPIANLDAATRAKGRWKLLLNQLDLDLGREFFVSKWMTLRPHAGVRSDWIEQKLKAEYENFTDLLPASSEVDIKYRDSWWGVGLEAGLDSQWGLGSGWSIFANLAAAILYGEHNIRFKDKNDPAAYLGNGLGITPSSGVFANVRDKTWIAHPILDLQLGLRWDGMVANDHLHIGVHLGWENHVYFSQNQFPIFSDDYNFGKFFANQGDLSLEGWTLGMRPDF